MVSLSVSFCFGLLIYPRRSCLSGSFLFIFLYGMMNRKYLWQQFACRTGHKPAARLFHIIPARFFDAFLKMLNWEFRMKIILGEAFFNEIVLS